MSRLPRRSEKGCSSCDRGNRQDEMVKASRTFATLRFMVPPMPINEYDSLTKRQFCCTGCFSWIIRKLKDSCNQLRKKTEREDPKMVTTEEWERLPVLDHESLPLAGNTPKRLTNGTKSHRLKNSSLWRKISRVTSLRHAGKTPKRLTNGTKSYSLKNCCIWRTFRKLTCRQKKSCSKDRDLRQKNKTLSGKEVNLTSSHSSSTEDTIEGEIGGTAQKKKEDGRRQKCCMFLCLILAALALAWTIRAFSEEIYYSIALIPRVNLISVALLWVCACFTYCSLTSRVPLKTEFIGAFILVVLNITLVNATRHYSSYLNRYMEIQSWWLVSLLTPLLLVSCLSCVITSCTI